MLEGHPGVTPDTRLSEAETLFKVRSLPAPPALPTHAFPPPPRSFRGLAAPGSVGRSKDCTESPRVIHISCASPLYHTGRFSMVRSGLRQARARRDLPRFRPGAAQARGRGAAGGEAGGAGRVPQGGLGLRLPASRQSLDPLSCRLSRSLVMPSDIGAPCTPASAVRCARLWRRWRGSK